MERDPGAKGDMGHRTRYPNIAAARKARVPVFPLEVFLEVLNHLNPRQREDVETILKLRQTSWTLRDAVTSCMRGKLTFHLGRSMSDLRARMRDCWKRKASEDWFACFSGIGFHWLVLTDGERYADPQPSRPRPTPGFQITKVGHKDDENDGEGYVVLWTFTENRLMGTSLHELAVLERQPVEYNALELILLASRFVQDCGRQFTHVRIFSGAGRCGATYCRADASKCSWGLAYPWCNTVDACVAEHVLQCLFFKAVGVILTPQISQSVDNIRELDVSAGCAHYITYLVRGANDAEFSRYLAEYLQESAVQRENAYREVEFYAEIPDFLLMETIEPNDHQREYNVNAAPFDTEKRWPVTALEKVETLRFWSRVEDVREYGDGSASETFEAREDGFKFLAKHLPSVKHATYETGVCSRSIHMGELPDIPVESFSAVGFGRLFDPAKYFESVTQDSLRRLYIADCNIHRLSWTRLRERTLHLSSKMMLSHFLDKLLPLLPNLTDLVIEALEYDWNDYSGLVNKCFKSLTPSYRPKLANIPGEKFRRPLLTAFESDIEALSRLREAYMVRRIDRGLPVDAWSKFLLDNEKAIFEVITVEGMYETKDDYPEDPAEKEAESSTADS